MTERDSWRIGSLTPDDEPKDDSWLVGSLIPDDEPHNDMSYLATLFSDLGVVPQVEERQPEAPRIEGRLVEAVATDAPTLTLADGHVGGNGNRTEERREGPPADKEAVAIKSEPVRPFIDHVLTAEAAGEMPQASGGRRWRVAALSFVGFLAIGGTAAAVLSLGYQWNARGTQAVRSGAPVRPVAPVTGLAGAVIGGPDLASFQGCTTGEGLSPTALVLVAKNFVGATSPAVCLPTDEPRKKRTPDPGSTGTAPADQTTTATVVAGASAGSSGSGGTTPGSGGGDPGTGTDGGSGTEPGTGTGDPGTGDPGTGTGEEPTDGGTTEPDRPGNRWGKGGKPKGS